MKTDETDTLTDDDLLAEVRTECARWEARDELEAGFGRLFVLRDEALKRGLPLPISCPMEDPPVVTDESTVTGVGAAGGVPR